MNPPTKPDDARVQLPFVEADSGVTPDLPVDESTVRTLVDTFYDSIRKDQLLGPVFDRHVADWSLHLPKMYAFWSSVVLRTGRYAGRPIDAHARIPGLTQSHFDRWLELWRQAVGRVVPEAAHAAFLLPAQRMASSMTSVLFRDGPVE